MTGTPFRGVVHGTLKIAWWLGAAWFVVGVVRAFLIVDRRPRESKLLQDLFAGLVYLAAAFAIIAYVFDLPIQSLLATFGGDRHRPRPCPPKHARRFPSLNQASAMVYCGT